MLDLSELRRRAPDDARADHVFAWVENADGRAFDAVLSSEGPRYRTSAVDVLIEFLPHGRMYRDPERRAAALVLCAASPSELGDWTSETLGRVQPIGSLVSTLDDVRRRLALERLARHVDLVVDGKPGSVGTLIDSLPAREFNELVVRVAGGANMGEIGGLAALMAVTGRAQGVWSAVADQLAAEASGALAMSLVRAGQRWALPAAIRGATLLDDTWERFLRLKELEKLFPRSCSSELEAAARASLAGDPGRNNHSLPAATLARILGEGSLPILSQYLLEHQRYDSMVAARSLEVLGEVGLPLFDAVRASGSDATLASAIGGLIKGGVPAGDPRLRPYIERVLRSGTDHLITSLLSAIGQDGADAFREVVLELEASESRAVARAAAVALGESGSKAIVDPAREVERHLGREHAETIVGAMLPCIGFELDGSELRLVGESRLGGAPDVPPGFEWPINRGRPLDFLAQFQLRDLAGMRGAEVLPPRGILSFFYDLHRQPWGYDPSDLDGYRVFWFPDTRTLSPVEPPKRITQLPPRFIRVFQAWSLPEENSPLLSSVRDEIDDEDFWEEYLEVDARLRNAGAEVATVHQLLGHSLPVQSPMELEAQLVMNGLYCGDASGYEDPRAEQLSHGAADWMLLMQLDSDDAASLMWGDMGRLYFWIRRQDLADRHFGRVWMTLQCG